MGALTNKSFPFELRNWETEQIISFDPTESFGYDLKLIITKYQIIQTEPIYFKGFYKHTFINNKSRHFFNGLQNSNNINISFYLIKEMYKTLLKILYLFEINFLKNKIVNFLYLYYDNLSLDLLCLLSLLKQKYFFIKLKNLISQKTINNIESNILFNKIKLENSNLCILINTNPKFENTNFSLQLKQRILKGNFKLFNISSFESLSNCSVFLGTSTQILKLIAEGLSPLCQTLIYEKNPNIIINPKLFKLKNNSFIYFILTYLKKFITYSKLNTLNCSIYESGINLISNFFDNNSKILINFSSIYLINLQNTVIDNITNTNLLYLTSKNEFLIIHSKKVCLIQDYTFNNFYHNTNIKYTNYFYIPTKSFYQDSSLFLNTEGLIKKNSKLFINSSICSSWKLLRILFNALNNKFKLFKDINNFLINFNLKTRFNFIKLMFLLYLSKNVINTNYTINNVSSYFINRSNIILYKSLRFINVKMTFFLNDFYLNNKDSFSKNSLILIKLSKITNLQLTNFF